MKLIENTPVRTERSMAHINRGDLPHEWREVDVPVFSEADAARGARIRKTRVRAGLSLREASKLVGLSVVDFSALERSRVRPESADDEAALFGALEAAADGKPEVVVERRTLSELVRKTFEVADLRLLGRAPKCPRCEGAPFMVPVNDPERARELCRCPTCGAEAPFEWVS